MNATRYRFARHAQAWLPLLPVATVYLVVTLWIALAYPFPSMFDELAHLSVARAQYEHLDLFAAPIYDAGCGQFRALVSAK